MSDDPQRPRTVTRLRAEVPPGMGLTSEEGRQQIGRYEIIKTLGKGAMGVVYKARDPLLDRIVAVKTISSPQGAGRRVRAAFIERFQREAKAAAKMQHPAIVTIFDVGVDEESGAPYMVLEYLPGESMADRLDKVRFPLFRAVNTAMELASALSFAHKQRIVHRDVKPANVLHAGENRWKLADFGIARMPDSELTQVGIFMGTPGYSPPEAIREGRYTAQADVFAWGAVLYELVSGRIPYEGPDTKTTNSYVIAGAAQPPSKHDASIPAPIVKVIMTALEGSAERRYKDGGEVEAALRDAWDRCLTNALVHPSMLAMEEMPHDKVPALMHVARVPARKTPAPGSLSAPVSKTSSVGAPEVPLHEPLHIASARDGDGDDEQTTIIKRDDLRSMPPKPMASGPRTVQLTGGVPPPPNGPAPMRESRPVVPQPGPAGSGPLKLPGPPAQRSSVAVQEPALMASRAPAQGQSVAPAARLKAGTANPPTAPTSRGMPKSMIILLLILVAVSTVAILHFIGVVRLTSLI
ncbi:MAG: serine/threonine protein kinase [Kofleriaceae bacterium]|nr:serine/threonine protein kinase [Kofleriaceae bacterium]